MTSMEFQKQLDICKWFGRIISRRYCILAGELVYRRAQKASVIESIDRCFANMRYSLNSGQLISCDPTVCNSEKLSYVHVSRSCAHRIIIVGGEISLNCGVPFYSRICCSIYSQVSSYPNIIHVDINLQREFCWRATKWGMWLVS